MAYVIRRGYTGLAVKKMQHYLNVLRTTYPDLPVLKEDGSFELIRRAETPEDYFATLDFLKLFG